jgi:hypothetical protein
MPFFPWLPLIIFGGLWSIAVDNGTVARKTRVPAVRRPPQA